MILDSYDIETEPLVTMRDVYGERRQGGDKCLILFSNAICAAMRERYPSEKIAEVGACNGNIPVWRTEIDGCTLDYYLSPIGSAMAAQCCAEVNWLTGVRRFIMFGSCGSLDASATAGKFILPTEAYRDEGMSYHYAPPADYIRIRNSGALAALFAAWNIPFVEGRVWTTDAILRETRGQYARRRAEGCIAVEMELAGVQAVCDFYGFELYDFLAAGDVLSEDAYSADGLPRANHDTDKLYIALRIARAL